MTDSRERVTQVDREAAALIFDHYAPNYAALCRKGSNIADSLVVVQTLTRHGQLSRAALLAELAEPSPELLKVVAFSLRDGWAGHGPFSDLETAQATAAIKAIAAYLEGK